MFNRPHSAYSLSHQSSVPAGFSIVTNKKNTPEVQGGFTSTMPGTHRKTQANLKNKSTQNSMDPRVSPLDTNGGKGEATPVERVEKTDGQTARWFRFKKTVKPTITYEEIGWLPRSFNRVFDRFLKQLFSDVEILVVEEYRFYRYLFLTTVQSLALLIFVPLLVNLLGRQYVVGPLAEYVWNTQQSELFLNLDQQKKAYKDLTHFEETLYFDLLSAPPEVEAEWDPNTQIQCCMQEIEEKTLELAVSYNQRSIEAITNFFSDVLSFLSIWFLLWFREAEMTVAKVFLLEVFFGMEDSKKSLVILFVTDLLVGYHSPNIWEFCLLSVFNHYELPESRSFMLGVVATLPVLINIVLKYLVFRHLNRLSPSTVAVYHAMIE